MQQFQFSPVGELKSVLCLQSLFERQGLVPPSAPEKSTMPLPRGMSRTKSFGETRQLSFPPTFSKNGVKHLGQKRFLEGF